MKIRSSDDSGFSMLELSIYLVIIGLVVGSIITGSSLIRGSELRAMEKDLDKYVSAVEIFQDRYNALPGDFASAVKHWGAKAGGTADGADATCLAYYDTTHTPTKNTCNGDGDGKIEETDSSWREVWQAWQHLGNSGIIEGIYTGQGNGTAAQAWAEGLPNVNAPAGNVADEVYTLRWLGSITNTADPDDFVGEYGNILLVGARTQANDSFLDAQDMQSIDSKIDDGKPGTGNIRTRKGSFRPECASSDDPATAIYKLNAAPRGCNIVYITGF